MLMSPAIAFWTLASANYIQISPLPFYDYVLYSFAAYLIWLVAYYIIVLTLAYSFCQKNGYHTYYARAMSNKTTFGYRFCGYFGEEYRKIMYCFRHAVFILITLALSYIPMNFGFIHCIFVVGILVMSLWKAANYYMDVFTKHYELEVQLSYT